MKIEITQPYGFSFIGMKSNNEDTIYPNPEKASKSDSLFLVCDGVGGRDKGEVASTTLSAALSESISGGFTEPFSQTDFEIALAKAYNRLNKLEDPQVVLKMGSTLTLLKFHAGGAMIAHIGDSRVYHIRPSSNQPLLFRTEDHSLVATLVKAGMITEEEAAVHPKRNVIHRAVQPNQDEPAMADIYETLDLQPGDYFFLCSDGVLENLTDDLLISLLQKEIADKDKIAEIEQICEGKTNDNYSAWLVQVKNVLGNEVPKPEKEVFVLNEASQDPLTVKGKVKRMTPDFRIRKWRWIMLFSVLVILVIAIISYTKKSPTKPFRQSDSIENKEIKSTNPDPLNSGKVQPKANGVQNESSPILTPIKAETKPIKEDTSKIGIRNVAPNTKPE